MHLWEGDSLKNRVCALVGLTVLLSLSSLGGAQTIYGPGGLFVHPSAFVPQRGAIGLNVSWFSQKIDAGGRTEWLPVSLTYGATERLEVGALYVNRRARGRQRDSGGVFAKYQIGKDSAGGPAIALAGSYVGGDVQQSSLSLVASHAFKRGDQTLFTAHLGGQWARRADIPVTKDDFGGFIGLELPLIDGLSLVGEAGTRFRFDRNSTSAIGLMWKARNGISIGVGYVNVGRSDNNRFFVGVGYPFGGNK